MNFYNWYTNTKINKWRMLLGLMMMYQFIYLSFDVGHFIEGQNTLIYIIIKVVYIIVLYKILMSMLYCVEVKKGITLSDYADYIQKKYKLEEFKNATR